jgi:hypothetical protein
MGSVDRGRGVETVVTRGGRFRCSTLLSTLESTVEPAMKSTVTRGKKIGLRTSPAVSSHGRNSESFFFYSTIVVLVVFVF